MRLRLGHPTWALLLPGYCKKTEARGSMGLVPQPPHVAASRAAAGGLPVFPNLLPARCRSRVTQFLDHSGRGVLEREMLGSTRTCIGTLEEVIGK